MGVQGPGLTGLELDRFNDVVLSLHYNPDGSIRWFPHSGQKSLIQAVFNSHSKFTFVRCPRKWGKTESVLYCLARRGLLAPDQQTYYLAPWQKQAREIAWESGRLIRMIPQKFIAHVDNKDMRITFDNGSFIKCDGSDNYAIYRGINPDMVALEEFADFDERLAEHMLPNLRAKDAPLIIIGTPPVRKFLSEDTPVQYVKFEERAKRQALKGNGFFLHASITDNTHLNMKAILEERDELIANNDEDIWKREYLAEYCEVSKGSIFPMLSETEHIKEHSLILSITKERFDNLEFYCIFDPGTKSVFAVLFLAYDRANNQFYLLDELYLKDHQQTSSDYVWPKAKEVMTELNPNTTWRLFYDEAASWFQAEVANSYGVVITPTHKAQFKRERGELKPGISILKALLRRNKVIASDRCKNWFWEMRNYKVELNNLGNPVIPDKNDHLIDTSFYAIFITGCTYKEKRLVTPQQITYVGGRRYDNTRLSFPGPVGRQQLEDIPYDFD